jgi:HSP20 family protein
VFYTTLSRIPQLRDPVSVAPPFTRPLDASLGGLGETESLRAAWAPACDIFEDREAVRIILEIPGVLPEDVKLSLEHNRLSVRGEKRQVAEEHTERVHRYERSYGGFERVFTLPPTIDPERIEARVEHGVLTVRLAKVERARPREIPVMTAPARMAAEN